MIDFQSVRAGQVELADLARGLTSNALAELTRALTNEFIERLADAIDEDVLFVPEDPAADDSFAAHPAEVGLAWTLGHVIVHVTASAEEAAFLAAELARGVEPHGRSRSEVPWPTIRTISACHSRLRESERIILATLGTWPDEPHLDIVYTTSRGSVRNAPARFLGGMIHADDHLGQVSEIVRQARAGRTPGS